jgi:tRNA-uridine 2-sulfurtransferase
MAKVVIAMSGGVDSSAAAALLKKEGHEVTGMMLRLWSEQGREDTNRCCSPDSMSLARRVAAKLELPFYVVDAREIFHNTIVKNFLEGYGAGQTPNPCLLCNRVIRWEYLLSHALDMGAEFLATGHYVRIQKDEKGKIQLLRANDRLKDQSYVLHMLTQEKLARSLFPAGEYPKSEIRKVAKSFDLPTATRADSQDLCFLAGEDYRDFIRRNAPQIAIPGLIMTRLGETLGKHGGLAYYTIGQRKGLGLSSRVPLYVIAKDVINNTLIVGAEDELGSFECEVTDINWISGESPSGPFRAEVKTRYTAKEAWAEVAPQGDGKSAKIHFDAKVRDLTPGQAAVFYAGEVLIGGGRITL